MIERVIVINSTMVGPFASSLTGNVIVDASLDERVARRLKSHLAAMPVEVHTGTVEDLTPEAATLFVLSDRVVQVADLPIQDNMLVYPQTEGLMSTGIARLLKRVDRRLAADQ